MGVCDRFSIVQQPVSLGVVSKLRWTLLFSLFKNHLYCFGTKTGIATGTILFLTFWTIVSLVNCLICYIQQGWLIHYQSFGTVIPQNEYKCGQKLFVMKLVNANQLPLGLKNESGVVFVVVVVFLPYFSIFCFMRYVIYYSASSRIYYFYFPSSSCYDLLYGVLLFSLGMWFANSKNWLKTILLTQQNQFGK